MTVVESRKERARRLRRNPTPAEYLLWQFLRQPPFKPWHFRRQSPMGRFFADFVCKRARLIIEIDGWTHDASRDAKRDAWFSEKGYRTLRFSNHQVQHELEGVCRAIMDALTGLDGGAPPYPSPEGEGTNRTTRHNCIPSQNGER